MAVENIGQSFSLEANTDLSAAQYRFVQVINERIGVTLSSGNVSIGVLQNKPDALGQAATVWGTGSVSKVIAGENITAGDDIMSHTDGSARQATSGNRITGTSLTSGNTGELISVFLTYPGRSP